IVKHATRPAVFKWRQTAPELILGAVRWYLRYSLSLRDVEELFAERGLKADHTTIWRWVQSYGPELDQRLRRHLKPTNKSWRVDETYIRVQGRLVLPLSGHRLHRCHHRLPTVGVARCRGGRTPVPQGADRSTAPEPPRHQHRKDPPLLLGDCR